jgi:hypothetical protein
MVVMDSGLARFTRALGDKRYALARGMTPRQRGHEVLDNYFLSGIGAAVFSAGAGGNAGVAPAFCASASGRAGSGAGVVGRSPPGLDSAGGLS